MLSNAHRGATVLAAAVLISCGGGGGDAGTPNPPPPPPPPANQFLALSEVIQVPDAVFASAPRGDARLFIVDRRGRVRILENGTLRTEPFVDISARTSTAGEGGMLSMAFDPQYASNGHVFIVYVSLDNVITVERLTVGANPNLLDPTSSLVILRIPHPDFTNHYGGQLAFGPDGYLYLSTGDGGGAGDPRGNGQNPQSLLGKLLRIDVRSATLTRPYDIPADNPWITMSSRRGEIWAYGLRNPWRFGFDGTRLYIADVGQSRREEVNISEAGTGALNYGWNTMEGSACYNTATCSTTGLTLPAYEYEHGQDNVNGCSITGGEVYRGSKIAHLVGSYLFSDFCGGYLKSLRYTGSGAPAVTTWSVPKVGGVVSFGRDGAGELYVIASSGRIYRIDPSATPTGNP